MRSQRLIMLVICVLLVLAAIPHPQARAAQIGYEDRFGYSQLESGAQKRAYVLLEEQVANVVESFLVDAGEQVTTEDMKAAADALGLDRPDFFYFVSGNLRILQFTDGALAVNPRYVLHNQVTPELSREALLTLAGRTSGQIGADSSFMTEGVEEAPGITLNAIRAAKTEYEAKIGSILQSIPTSAVTIHDKIKYLHDYLVKNITYQSSNNDQNTYSAIVEGTTVCAGYTKSYQDLLTRLGIKCWYVTGFARESHAWNVLWLNGECVYTDVTWADQGTYILNKYYNISKEQMAQDHTMDPQYAAVLGSCNHSSHKHTLTPENAADAVAEINEYSFPGPGQTASLTYPGLEGGISYHSSDPAVVTVTNDGALTAAGEGTAVITIILEREGYAVQYRITVGVGHQHSMEKVPGALPSCTAEGIQEYWRCTGCSRNFYDQLGAREIADLQELKVPKAEHIGGNWQHDATHHWKSCQWCGSLVEQSDGSHADTDQNNTCDTCGYGLPAPETQPTEPPATQPPATEPVTEPPATEPSVPDTTEQTEATQPTTEATQPSTEGTQPNASESTEASGGAPTSPTQKPSQSGDQDEDEKTGLDPVVAVVIGAVLIAGVVIIFGAKRKK